MNSSGCPSAGTIPACAGEPSSPKISLSLPGDYPRVRGGTVVDGVIGGIEQGLSPRARGNRPAIGVHGNPQGTIPACAGEPRRR